MKLPGYKSPERNALIAATQRCHNSRCREYRLYGARGLRVCDEWRGRNGFAAFFAHVGPRPGPGYSLDRIDNRRGYEPGNVRWANQSTQTSNRRGNVIVEWNGERLTAAAWSKRTGVPKGTICNRIHRGWPVGEALTLLPGVRRSRWARR